MASILKLRSAITQAGFNERVAKLISYEFVYASLFIAGVCWYHFGFQWFWWGLILSIVGLAVGISIPVISVIIVAFFAALWAIPFFFIAALGINAFYLIGVVMFFVAIWVHAKAFTYFADLSRWD